jgi:hypothetical protein
MLISRIFNNKKYQISYGFTGKFIGEVHTILFWFLSPLQRLKYVNNMPTSFFSAKPEAIPNNRCRCSYNTVKCFSLKNVID